ncbi:hypothetical protein A2930_03160 [Candidatus Giovannonibacteria bacterium RIFCSPLOWO2_01_FULL_45_34]|uniref:Uncharacterized protein n=1 Tax=Candidatus Giovannonibacteria bacterium RIFCSPLOWO2_01_FULL_45_34 TaxID=1798351 RepID=A0A1F5X075_9BACT|nr:MAG: hypothetical protein A2930_03160 [Candidatus Giovannonibacteria bacterium RIFCSPLOWO2_01_FULL_45_34]
MRFNMFLSLFIGLILTIFVAGCAVPFTIAARDIGVDKGEAFKYTKRQAKVAEARARLYIFGKYNKEKKAWELRPDAVSVEDVEKVVADETRSLNTLLGYEDEETARFIDWFPGFREGLLREERAALWILRRLQYVKFYNQFTDLVGELPPELRGEEYSYFFPVDRKSYSMRLIYPEHDISKLVFSAVYLETAKKDGTLKLVDTFHVSSVREFSTKEQSIRDANEFLWKNENRHWLIKSYKILPDKDKPQDNIVQYIEVWRTNAERVAEATPAVRGFVAIGDSKVSVFVADYDKAGAAGYGSPDLVYKAFADIVTGSDMFNSLELKDKLLLSIYDPPRLEEKPVRRKPKEHPLYTEVVKMGDVSVDLWEKGTWTVPFEYKSFPQKVSMDFMPPKTQAEKDTEKEGLKKIAIIKQEFKKSGDTVIAFWLPKDNYLERNVSYYLSLSDTIILRKRGGVQENGEAAYFGKRVKALVYSFGGRWFMLMDEDGDGVFEKRKTIPTPAGVVEAIVHGFQPSQPEPEDYPEEL